MENSSMFFIFAMIFANMEVLYLPYFDEFLETNKINIYMKRRLTDFVMLLSVVVAMSMASCSSYKKVPYLQNSRDLDTLIQQASVYEPVIQPNDMLDIVINSELEQSTVKAYNFSMSGSASAQTFFVDTEGCVNVPNVGEVHLAGLTIPQAEIAILDKVKGLFATPPVVVVRFADYKVTVLGEVKTPGVYNTKDGKINIFQALSQAGDLTVYGKRDNVKIIREEKNGEKKVYEVNLNDALLLTSPLYYLQQNDIVYVTPNKSRAKSADLNPKTTIWFSSVSLGVTLINLMLNITNRIDK